MKRILLVLFFTCSFSYAESPKQWLDDYFEIANAQVAEQTAFVLSKKPTLNKALDAMRKSYALDDVMYRYLFVYHIEHATGKLHWNDGDWMLSIMVCNCGVEGSVPTPEFKKLFEKRSSARTKLEKKVAETTQEEIWTLMRQMPKGWDASYKVRIACLKDRFEILVTTEANCRVSTY